MRLIDADAFKWWVDDHYDCTELGQIVMEWINDRPTIEAEPVRRGRWKQAKVYSDIIFCDECGEPFEKNYLGVTWNYCPTCGAKMEEE